MRQGTSFVSYWLISHFPECSAVTVFICWQVYTCPQSQRTCVSEGNVLRPSVLPWLSLFTCAGLFVRRLFDSHLMTENVPQHSKIFVASHLSCCVCHNFRAPCSPKQIFFITVVSLYCLWYFARRTKKVLPCESNKTINNIFIHL